MRPIPIELSIRAGEKTGIPRRGGRQDRIRIGKPGPEEGEELAGGRRAARELFRDLADHPVGVLELELIDVRVVDPVEVEATQLDVVRTRSPDPVLAADRLVKVLIQDRARRDDDVDDSPLDQVAQHLAQTRRDKGSRQSEQDGRAFPVLEGVLPHFEATTEVTRLDRGRLELVQEVAEPCVTRYVDGNDGAFEEGTSSRGDRTGHGDASAGPFLTALASVNEV